MEDLLIKYGKITKLEKTDYFIILGFIFRSVLLVHNAKGVIEERPRWMWQHSRFASQVRNSKLREELKLFIMSCKQTNSTFALEETLSQPYKIILYTSALEMKVQS